MRLRLLPASGFCSSGFARFKPLKERFAFFQQWIDKGRAGYMGWLAREPERCFDLRRLDTCLRPVESLAYPHTVPVPPDIDWPAELRGRIASYALGPDYHDTVLKRTRAVATTLSALRPDAVTRIYVDTGPVFEREWAAEARLGWFGRNTNHLNRYHG